MVKKTAWMLLVAALLTVPYRASADENAETIDKIKQALTKKMPTVKIGRVAKLPYAGLYEAVSNNTNIFYTDEKGDIALIGNLFDLNTQTNLTEQSSDRLQAVDFSKLPLDKAIVKVKGDGSRKLAIFTDPDCPYCKQLEKELDGISDVTLYVFLFPIAQLHPDAPRKAALVWCAQDRAAAWDSLMHDGKEPPASAAKCATPIPEIAELAKQISIVGTPGLIFASGKLAPGLIPREKIEHLLGAPGKS